MNGMENILSIQNVMIYLIMINLIGFLVMLIDKKKAKKQTWRISEKTLIYITLLGGGIGTTTGMYAFRHKTKKMRFTIGFPVITISEVILIIYIFLIM